MIKASNQLKAKVRNLSGGDTQRAQTLIRTFIMEEHEYPGIRIMMEATLDRMRQAVKIDISTGDVITPGAVEFSYKLMFEERSFSDEKNVSCADGGHTLSPFIESPSL